MTKICFFEKEFVVFKLIVNGNNVDIYTYPKKFLFDHKLKKKILI